jgi:hypothetical protein
MFKKSLARSLALAIVIAGSISLDANIRITRRAARTAAVVEAEAAAIRAARAVAATEARIFGPVSRTPQVLQDAAKVETKSVSRRVARRRMMRDEGIPTSQQPISQTRSTSGFAYEYRVPMDGGGSQIKSISVP